jgi:adenylate cyclase
LYKLLGEPERSEQAARRTMARIDDILRHHPDTADMLGLGAATLVFLGEYVRAEQWARQAMSLEPESYTVRYNAACTFAVIGEPDVAMECLEYVYAHMPRVRRWLLGISSHHTQLDSLRDRQDFHDLMARLRADTAA